MIMHISNDLTPSHVANVFGCGHLAPFDRLGCGQGASGYRNRLLGGQKGKSQPDMPEYPEYAGDRRCVVRYRGRLVAERTAAVDLEVVAGAARDPALRTWRGWPAAGPASDMRPSASGSGAAVAGVEAWAGTVGAFGNRSGAVVA